MPSEHDGEPRLLLEESPIAVAIFDGKGGVFMAAATAAPRQATGTLGAAMPLALPVRFILMALLLLSAVASPRAEAAERLCTPLPCKHNATALPPAPDGRRCYLLAVTYGGQTKEEAVAKTQQAMKEMLPRWGRLNRLNLRRATISAMQPEPYPFFRSKVTPALAIKPDVVTKEAHTICWEGITLPVACTAGAKVCG